MIHEMPPIEQYELGEQYSQGDHFRIWKAIEKTTGSHCLYHRINFPEGYTEGDEMLAMTLVRNFARLSIPRAPRLVDAWVGDGHLVAIEYRWEATPISDNYSKNQLRNSPARQQASIFERTLFFLATMHKNNLVHEGVKPSVFGIDNRNKVFLLDMGLEKQLVKALHGNRNNFSLAGNLQARDLADWAFHFLGLTIGMEVLETNAEEDNWDEIDFRNADQRLSNVYTSTELRGFFIDCLTGYAVGRSRFETAYDAWKFWEDRKIMGLFK